MRESLHPLCVRFLGDFWTKIGPKPSCFQGPTQPVLTSFVVIVVIFRIFFVYMWGIFPLRCDVQTYFVCVCVMIIDLHSKWFGQKSDVVFDSSSKALAIRQVSRGRETYVLLQFYPFVGNESGKTRGKKIKIKIKKMHELHLYVRYVGVVRFVFHVLQLLLMRFTQRKVWRINKSMMKHQQESDQNSGMPLMFWLWLLKGRVCWWLNNT